MVLIIFTLNSHRCTDTYMYICVYIYIYIYVCVCMYARRGIYADLYVELFYYIWCLSLLHGLEGSNRCSACRHFHWGFFVFLVGGWIGVGWWAGGGSWVSLFRYKYLTSQEGGSQNQGIHQEPTPSWFGF